MNKIRTRFAPSPTGLLHIGSLRTALYAYLFAKKNGGDFILRIEDTDQKRNVPGGVKYLMETLKKFNLNWDKDPYIQSEHLEVYKKYAEQMVASGDAYYCFCDQERLDESRKKQVAEKKAPMYDQLCRRNSTPEEIKKNMENRCPYTIRLKVPENRVIVFDDVIRGKVRIESSNIDDQVLLKSDGFPTYHLANVVDDYLMKITHVIRGEEWLPSTPKHVLIYEALNWESPKFVHLSLLLNADKSKLSKRQGDVAVEDYLAKGYLEEALLNFVALIGWNPGQGSTQEVFSLQELIKYFELEKVHKAGAVFDPKKLDWINSQYIKKLSIDELYQKAIKFLEQKEFFQKAPTEKKSEEYIKKILQIEQDRLENLFSVGESSQFFFQDLEYDKNLLAWKNMSGEEIKNSLEKAQKILEEVSGLEWRKDSLEKIMMEKAGAQRGELLWPLRVALTGEKKSPSPFEVVWVLGKEESLKRLEAAISRL
ncbi:MAG: glutamate--tRNA ligase [Candidatus Moranbacteria bacterium CG10_big_fil_rev_8_21_14_0_10_35_21]|nr:MAG: glutamate--tRNA ligase [Candidatus Moranbacteria bacterium CG10_big_fil_rev_8_21_14_0_10_35_21]PJA88590.1 MAG: glutamate--tRNA ligase [Candidatus Moranbacteria bacterium CG_4_9_14_3_um_filter_36_9]